MQLRKNTTASDRGKELTTTGGSREENAGDRVSSEGKRVRNGYGEMARGGRISRGRGEGWEGHDDAAMAAWGCREC